MRRNKYKEEIESRLRAARTHWEILQNRINDLEDILRATVAEPAPKPKKLTKPKAPTPPAAAATVPAPAGTPVPPTHPQADPATS